MPQIEYPDERPALGTFRALDYTPEEPEIAPDTMTILGAAWRQDHTIGSASNNKMAGIDRATRDGLTGEEVWSEIQGTPYEQHWDRLAGVFNRRAFTALKSQIDMEREDRRILDAGGWTAVGAQFGVSLFDWPSLLPGGALVKGATTGATIARTAVSTGLAGALGAGVSEFALQATQETRPLEESVLAIGGGAVLGTLLGSGVGALFSAAERKAALASVDHVRAQPDDDGAALADFRAGLAEGQSAGAAAVEKPVLEDYDIAKGAKAVGKATAQLNPLTRAAHSPSAVHRANMADIAETGYYLEKNVRGEGNLAVESAVKYWDRGALTKGLEETQAIYAEARKTADFDMTPEEFRTAVSKAMRRGDVGDNDVISKAASVWRERLFEPLKQAAIEVGLLPADVNVKTAVSYLTRIWNSPRLNAGEARFKSIVGPWIDEQLAQLEFKADEIRIGNKIVDADKQREALTKATDRLEGLEDRLTQRRGIRDRKAASLEGLRKTRLDVLKERAPADLVKRLRNMDENAVMVDAVKEVRKAERAAGRKQSFGERSPVLALIRSKGGVRIGSKLDQALRAMDVTPKTHPGMFRKEGGIGDLDNFVQAEDAMFANLPGDGAGYVDANAVLDAIRGELAGVPLRTADEDAAAALLDNLDKVAAKWLEDVGLPPNASVKEVRDFIDRVTGAEKNLDGMDSRISRLESELADFDAAGDKLVNEREISAMEARTLSEGLTKLELELDGVRDLANASPRVSLVVDYATTKRDLFKAKLAERSLRKRVDALKRMEAEGKANDDMLAELAAKSVDLERMQADIGGLKVKADKLEPMVPKVKQEIPEFVSPQDRADYVNGIVDDIFDQLTGRANQGMPSYDMVMSSRGPLKERTFNIPDHLIEEFLEHDIELIARRYARVMAADVELTRMDQRHGGPGKPTLQAQIDRLKDDYRSLREQVEASDLGADAKAKELKRLKNREKSDVEDFSSVRDLLRGQYKVDSQHTNYARALRAAGTFNYIRQLGGVLVASVTDAVRPAMVHGLGRYMSEGIAPLLSNLDAVKLSIADAKTVGAVTERMTQSRIATMAELADPYAQNSPFERLIDNMGTLFSRMSLLSWWNDMHKSIASVLVQNRILKNAALGDYAKLDPDERRYMGFLGIDEHMAERIARQFDQFGEVDGNVHIPGIERWDDEGARRAFAGGLNKDVDSIIVTKSVADVPLFAHTPTGRALLQFKTFAIASNQRVLMRGLQDGPGSMVTGILGMSTLGMAAYYFKQKESGRELSNNPGTWIAEGFERSGILSVGMEINNTWEKIGGPGFFALASATGRLAVPGADGRQPASRYANRDAFGALLGPSFQLGTDAAQLLGVPARGLSGDLDVSPADVGRATGMIPFATLPYWRWILEGGFNMDEWSGFKGVEPSLKELAD
ncbi:hypothetical protein [Aminobacter ciceronei]|uniref:Uncharacterized protein n=1 Tax=Aminobacter ciceronei TaxID=150723 RepID=A0ABR6CFX6_9HYPH|nr:hypothetical protein [Aminobacter ciceronei]MBA8910143.1 hypothetical protein [Aminobacter ciceronei]MBA9023915.1 hypothetical protein [Aminobacter ciceronei]